MSDLLPYVQLVAGTDKGFVDVADRQESVLLRANAVTSERNNVASRRTISSGPGSRTSPTGKSHRRRLTEDVNVKISRRYLGRVRDEGSADRLGASQFDPLATLDGPGRH